MRATGVDPSWEAGLADPVTGMGSIVSVLTQVTFRFDTATDIRYLARPPRQGDHVRTVDGRLWVVTDVAEDEGSFVVICVPLGGDDPASL